MIRRHDRPSLAEFDEWSERTLAFRPSDDRIRQRYQSNAQNCQNYVQNHPFIQQIQRLIIGKSKQNILFGSQDLIFYIKPYNSVINKMYRKNILVNSNFPDPPDEGWITPDNCFARIGDTIRSMLICRYLDEPEKLAKILSDIAASISTWCSYEAQARETGYYAYHFDFIVPAEIHSSDWSSVQIDVRVEIQLTTQLQEVMKKLTHIFYEEVRIGNITDNDRWKWDAGSPRFLGTYLGHTLHLIEGMIVQLRDSVDMPHAPDNDNIRSIQR